MKKILILFSLTILLLSCAYANDSSVEIGDAEFDIPAKYQGGELINGKYRLENIFSIKCIDDNVPDAIGLWACEKDSSEELNIENHPVRHYWQYNEYLHDNHSHAYFASGESVYEISWAGEEIDSEIEKLIKNTPKSKISDDAFYSALDKSVNIYKQQRIDKLNKDAEYNYLEAKSQSQYKQEDPDNTKLNRILLTYYNSK